jgi:8-oxo-dGTP diphosphatase
LPYQPTDPRPIPAAIAVVVRDTQVLLVRRANPPDAGLWGFPGGRIDPGEPLFDAAIRELAEETGVSADPLRVITALDAFDHDGTGTLRRHFILVAVLCRWTAGDPIAADDALEARWIEITALKEGHLALSRDVAELADHAAALMAEVPA